jgi:hypothetical protein
VNHKKIWYALAGVALVGGTLAVTNVSVSAVPSPTVCIPYVATDDTWPTATLRTTVRVCTPVNDNDVITSTCEIVELVRTDGVVATVRDTCTSTTTSAAARR